MRKRVLLVLGIVWLALVLGWMIYINSLVGNIECGKAFCNTSWIKFIVLFFISCIPSWILFWVWVRK